MKTAYMEQYEKEIRPALMRKFKYKNVMQVPKLTKIVRKRGSRGGHPEHQGPRCGLGDMALIAGQKPVITKASKSIASFKLRKGMPIGCMVTLRRERMYEFYQKLVTIVLPRVRDFKGISPKAFDGRGNYTLGLKEQIIFPEIEYDKVDRVRGMNITIATTAKTMKRPLSF